MSAMYKCISVADVIHKRKKCGNRIDTYRTKGQDSIDIIKKEKDNIRFILGDTDGFRAIGRLRTWMFHKENDIETQEKLVSAADKLRKEIDTAIFYAIRKGKEPKESQIKKIRECTDELYRIYNSSRTADEENELENE